MSTRSYQVTVTAADGVAAIERFARDIDRLNETADRPNPFMSSEFLRCYALRSEYHVPGAEERLYIARSDAGVVGIAPMRRTPHPLSPTFARRPLRSVRLGFLAPWDSERPGVLAAPADEDVVTTAIIRHVAQTERDLGMLEFVGQQPGGTIHRAVHAAAGGVFRARDIPVEPYTEIPVRSADLNGYFAGLSKRMRSNVSRQARRLFAAGEPQLVLAEGAAAVSAWFDAYCDLDDRSWKHGTRSSMRRHPRRVRFFRDVVAGRAGLEPSFVGIVLDGVLIAGLIVSSSERVSTSNHGAWCMEMAYDQARSDLGPGQLLLLLSVGQAIRRGDRFVNFMQNFSYYKHRWGAEPIDVVNTQLIRRASLIGAQAAGGDMRRKWAARRAEGDGHSEQGAPDTPVHHDEPAPGVRAVDPGLGRSLTATALAADVDGVTILRRDDVRTFLPFDID